jgi:hypothetical protein
MDDIAGAIGPNSLSVKGLRAQPNRIVDPHPIRLAENTLLSY